MATTPMLNRVPVGPDQLVSRNHFDYQTKSYEVPLNNEGDPTTGFEAWFWIVPKQEDINTLMIRANEFSSCFLEPVEFFMCVLIGR